MKEEKSKGIEGGTEDGLGESEDWSRWSIMKRWYNPEVLVGVKELSLRVGLLEG